MQAESRSSFSAPAAGVGVQRVPRMQAYRSWLAQERGLAFDADYQALWHWSVTELDAFWQSIWDYFELQSPTPVSYTHLTLPTKA